MTKSEAALEFWEVWYPRAAATGVLIGRGLLRVTDVLIVHSAPDVIDVAVTDPNGGRLAYGRDLERTLQSPMCRLTRRGAEVMREDIWPTEADYGRPVLLPGGEVGILESWWNADDRKEWRWDIEFYNSIR